MFIELLAVVNLTAQLLIVAAVFQVADGIQVASISALQGLADVRVPAIIAELAYWVLAVPLGSALAFPGQLGAVGIWIGLAVGLAAAACGLAWRFHSRPAKPPVSTGRCRLWAHLFPSTARCRSGFVPGKTILILICKPRHRGARVSQ